MTASASPLSCADVIAYSAYTLYTYEAAEPKATSVSILGAPCAALLKPLMKNLWFITIIIVVKRSCVSPIAI